MRITKVYTKVGDKGGTRLVGGTEVSKADPRIEAYGTVDELSAVIGLARTFNTTTGANAEAGQTLDTQMRAVQNDLFDVGADLATRPEDRWEGMHRVGEPEVTRLENWIDKLNEDLPPLEEFILPGGGPVGGFLHQARTVCRRAERALVRLEDSEPDTAGGVLPYLNRLSDWLFVAARWAAKAHGEPEYQWERQR